MTSTRLAKLRFCLKKTLERTFIPTVGHVAAEGSTTSTFYDRGLELVGDFHEAFPGKLDDPDLVRSQSRLAKLFREFYEEGWFDRERRSNHDLHHGEARWQYVYFLTRHCIRHLRAGGTLDSWVDDELSIRGLVPTTETKDWPRTYGVRH